MKKVIVKNITLSLCTFLLASILDKYNANFNFSYIYFAAILFHLSLYCFQAFVLSQIKNKKSFIMIYGLLSFLKILFSIFFIIIYLMFFSKQENQESQMMFLGFFILLYFGHLLLNTISIFSHPNPS